jgi:chemotaxis signal transduction protein
MDTPGMEATRARQVPPPAQQTYLTFELGERLFGIEVGRVRQVLQLEAMTACRGQQPGVPGYVHYGVERLPVIDVAAELGLPSVAPDAQARVIVLDAIDAADHRLAAFLAARVIDVRDFDERCALCAQPLDPAIGLRVLTPPTWPRKEQPMRLSA